ncbi:Dabb family protein [Anaeromicropila herbilytica]|uniref:Stress responsive protein n=1 Tax=Anaeromicropila herbilytica TaxID=2785025 RepID=A0A7R7IBJ2_9FIRM|nr:Dabb family protein [Anaeromicropila herbilytica]BCN29703.1 stress responsive protein [Anaeromicropila herbilytica]
MVRHIVLFGFKKEAEGRSALENAEIAKESLLSLKDKISVLRNIEVGINMENASSDNATLCLTCDFDHLDDLSIYANHEEHLKVAEFIGKVRESRSCVDYEI